MAKSALVDAGFLIALLNRGDTHHSWAVTQASAFQLPWQSCEAVLSEAFHLLGKPGGSQLATLLRRDAITMTFTFAGQLDPVLNLIKKYAEVPMSFADACLIRMTEMISDCVLLTTDSDFGIYRRHGRHIVPCLMPY